jgi:hypothetical protein
MYIGNAITYIKKFPQPQRNTLRARGRLALEGGVLGGGFEHFHGHSETIILSQIILSNSCVIMRRMSNDFAP